MMCTRATDACQSGNCQCRKWCTLVYFPNWEYPICSFVVPMKVVLCTTTGSLEGHSGINRQTSACECRPII